MKVQVKKELCFAQCPLFCHFDEESATTGHFQIAFGQLSSPTLTFVVQTLKFELKILVAVDQNVVASSDFGFAV